MDNPRVLCLGEVLFDCLADQLGKPLAEVESWTPYPGGAPANVACGLVKLGISSGFIGAVGVDGAGNELVQLLTDVGVNTNGVQRLADFPTRQVYVVRSLSGDRNFAGFGEYDTAEFADTRLQAKQIPESLFPAAEVLVLGTLELAYPESGAAVRRALELAQKYDLKIILDVNWRPVFWHDESTAPPIIRELFPYVDYIKLAKEEAEWLFGSTDPGAIKNRLDSVEGILITDGENGCAYCLDESEGKIPAFKIDVVDTTGAGDSFLAGFIHQLLTHGVKALGNPDTTKQAITFASAVGALTTLKPGAIASQPSLQEVEGFLK